MLTLSQTCKNCVKSKRDCAGYAQPLVYKQQNQEHGDSHHHEGDQFSFQDQDMAPSLRWQPEQQYTGSHHIVPQADSSVYNQLPFSASYHAMHLPSQDISHIMSTAQADGNHGWKGPPLYSSQPPLGISDSSGFHGLHYNPPVNGPENASVVYPFNSQVADQHIYASAYPQRATTLTAVPVFPFDNRLSEPQHMMQYQQRSASLSQQYGIPPSLVEGMWPNTAAFIGTYVC